MNIAIIFASGNGIRMGAGIPKQFLEINGKPILVYTIQLFQYHRKIDKIYVAVQSDYIPYVQTLVQEFHLTKVARILPGGDSAQDTIYRALKWAEAENDGDSIVLLHDGVRPFVSYNVISDNITSVEQHGNGITCTPCYETILTSKDGNRVEHVPYRKETFAAQAPQSFYLKDIIAIHDRIRSMESGYENMVDACTMCTRLNIPVHMVPGNRGNIKVTTPEDFYSFRALLTYRENEQAFGLGMTGQNRLRHAMDMP